MFSTEEVKSPLCGGAAMVCCSMQPQLNFLKRCFRCHDVPECSRRSDVLCLLLDSIRRPDSKDGSDPGNNYPPRTEICIDFARDFLFLSPFSYDAFNVHYEEALGSRRIHSLWLRSSNTVVAYVDFNCMYMLFIHCIHDHAHKLFALEIKIAVTFCDPAVILRCKLTRASCRSPPGPPSRSRSLTSPHPTKPFQQLGRLSKSVR